MTRKDYQALAQAVRFACHAMQADPRLTRVSNRAQEAINSIIIAELVSALRASNANFDAVRFAEACKG